MVNYQCKRCGYETVQRANFKKHLERKTKCEGNEEFSIESMLEELTVKKEGYTCECCSKTFRTPQLKYQHKLKCKQQNYIELQKKIDIIESQLKNAPQAVTTNNINTQNIQNIQINMKDFGQENTSYLPPTFLSRCFVNKDIVSLIEGIHCDKDHKENHNVRHKSLKHKMMETYVDGRWIVTDSNETLTDLIQNGYRILMKHSRKHKNVIIEEELDDDRDEFERLCDWLEMIYNDRRKQAPIKQKLLVLFFNNQALLLEKA